MASSHEKGEGRLRRRRYEGGGAGGSLRKAGGKVFAWHAAKARHCPGHYGAPKASGSGRTHERAGSQRGRGYAAAVFLLAGAGDDHSPFLPQSPGHFRAVRHRVRNGRRRSEACTVGGGGQESRRTAKNRAPRSARSPVCCGGA